MQLAKQWTDAPPLETLQDLFENQQHRQQNGPETSHLVDKKDWCILTPLTRTQAGEPTALRHMSLCVGGEKVPAQKLSRRGVHRLEPTLAM